MKLSNVMNLFVRLKNIILCCKKNSMETDVYNLCIADERCYLC